MNIRTIHRLQKESGLDIIQSYINNGSVWQMEGSMGRKAMELLESGACMLPKKSFTDYYGNRIPSRDDLKQGSKGTYLNAVRFWTNN
jgi:hypothetical protein